MITIKDLKACSMFCPLGIDVTPTFSWVLTGTGRDETQSAYRLTVSSTRSKADSGAGDTWDSGRISQDNTTDVVYEGNLLSSKTTYYWFVEIWSGGQPFKSEVKEERIFHRVTREV